MDSLRGTRVKKRLDQILVDQHLCESLAVAQAKIMAGEIFTAEGVRLDKAGQPLPPDIEIEIRSRTPDFASRGGHKLEHALRNSNVSPKGMICLDIGASTGGFTDCLLKHGAEHVFAVDVGQGLLDQKLRQDARVTSLERTNARFFNLEELKVQNPLAGKISLVVMDVSFISMRKVIEPLAKQFSKPVTWLLLFKPQFEVDAKDLRSGGVVKDSETVDAAIGAFCRWMEGLKMKECTPPSASPLPGKRSGNVEYLLHYEGPNCDSSL